MGLRLQVQELQEFARSEAATIRADDLDMGAASAQSALGLFDSSLGCLSFMGLAGAGGADADDEHGAHQSTGRASCSILAIAQASRWHLAAAVIVTVLLLDPYRIDWPDWQVSAAALRSGQPSRGSQCLVECG